MTQPPANWYPDPQNPAQLRYWDGARWTDQTAPASAPAATPVATATKRKMSTGAVVAIVLGGLLVVGVLLIGILAAVSIPVYQNQQDKARDAAAQGDLQNLHIEIATYAVEYGELPTSVDMVGTDYVISGPAGPVTAFSAFPGVSLVDYAPMGYDFCVAVEATEGSGTTFSIVTDGTISESGC